MVLLATHPATAPTNSPIALKAFALPLFRFLVELAQSLVTLYRRMELATVRTILRASTQPLLPPLVFVHHLLLCAVRSLALVERRTHFASALEVVPPQPLRVPRQTTVPLSELPSTTA